MPVLETLRELQARLPPLAFDFIRFANGLVLLLLLMLPLEKLFALHPAKIVRRGLLTDIGYYFLNSLLPNRLLIFPMTALGLFVQYAMPRGLYLHVISLPLWLRLTVSLVVAEVGFYWGHRWMHSSALLWRYHAVHHNPVQMDWLVNTHAHPVDTVFTRFCGYVPLYLLGLAHGSSGSLDWGPLLVALVGSIWGYFIHANVRLRFAWLEHLVATPAFHHWHHDKIGPGQIHKNYAPLFPWIDRIFGTFFLDRSAWPAHYGTSEPAEEGLVGQLLQPLLASRSGESVAPFSD